MGNNMILTGKITPLALGRPTTSDKYDVSNFFVDASVTEGITAGSFVAYGPTLKHYTKVGSDTTAVKIAGVYLDSQAKPVLKYPGGRGLDHIMPGEVGDVLIRGDVAVQGVVGVEPKEGEKVFLGTGADVLGLVTNVAGSGTTLAIELPNFTFLGINSEANGVRLCAVRKLY